MYGKAGCVGDAESMKKVGIPTVPPASPGCRRASPAGRPRPCPPGQLPVDGFHIIGQTEVAVHPLNPGPGSGRRRLGASQHRLPWGHCRLRPSRPTPRWTGLDACLVRGPILTVAALDRISPNRVELVPAVESLHWHRVGIASVAPSQSWQKSLSAHPRRGRADGGRGHPAGDGLGGAGGPCQFSRIILECYYSGSLL